MASHRGKKVGVWLSVLVVLVPLALQGAGGGMGLAHLWGHPLFGSWPPCCWPLPCS